ncbi:MAG: aminotransferase class I/II-fold pyridoxal phosphate-dependent enzyme [Opitutaceae bacterium]|nr:aminotransferase class I/II-fold pyridoxal phosphate-dependent enzyme [Opitutaceae bacterium]
MPQTSRRTAVFTESLIREMSRVAARHGAINLSQGFPDWDPPAALVTAAKAAMDASRHQYAVTWGSPELRAALGAKIGRGTGTPVDAERELVVTCGATEAMMVAMMTVCDPGDKVGLFSPFYENYNADAILTGAQPVHVPLHPPHYRFDPAELRAAFAQGLKAFVLCNPSNPCGRVFTREELLQIAALAEEFDTWVLTDEVYEHIVFAPHRHTYFNTLPGMAARTLMCSSLSKTFAITGWRLGYAIAPTALAASVRPAHDFMTICAPTPLQVAAVTALDFPAAYYQQMTEGYHERRSLMTTTLAELGFGVQLPEGAYYLLADYSRLPIPQAEWDSTRFARWLTTDVGVAVVPGTTFYGLPGYGEHSVRFAFPKRLETLREAGRRLERAIR